MRNTNSEREYGSIDGTYLKIYWVRCKSGAPIRFYFGSSSKVVMYSGSRYILGKFPFDVPQTGKMVVLSGSKDPVCGFLQVVNNTVYLTPYTTIEAGTGWIYADEVII